MIRVLRVLAALSAAFIIGCEPAVEAPTPTSNAIGAGTWIRCAHQLYRRGAKVYELSHVRSNSMPQSPWGPPLTFKYQPTTGIWTHGTLVF